MSETMTGQEQVFRKTPTDERDEAIKLQQELERKQQEYDRVQFDAQQKEVFGAYDTTVPNEGEDTYQSYLDKRPVDGIIRNGDTLVNSETRKFASVDAYEEQKGTAQDHYDTIPSVSIVETERKPAPYEHMGLMQLANEASKARIQGDSTKEADIREATVQHLTREIMSHTDDSETPEEAQARYDDELAHYEKLVDRIVARAEASSQHAENTHAKPSGEGTPSARTTETAPKATTPESLKGAGGYFKGMKVTVSRVIFENPAGDSKDVLELVDENGDVWVAYAEQIEYVKGSEKPAEEPAAEAPADAGAEEAPIDSDKDGIDAINDMFEEKVPGKELELYKGEKLSLKERAKAWFASQGRLYREFGGITYFTNLGRRGMAGVGAVTFNAGVKEGMTEEEVKEKQKRNRIVIVAAAAALVVAGIATGLAANHDWNGETPDLGNGDGAGSEGTPIPDEVKEVLDGTAEPTPPPVEVAPPVEGFNVTQGEGGIEMFSDPSINLGADVWYANEDALLAQFPGDFYRMTDGHVGLAHPGWISQEAQNFINSLR